MSSSPNSFTFLVLSDIHFGNSDDAPEFNVSSGQPRQIAQQQPGNKLQGLIDTIKTISPAPTAILVLGDLTSSARPSEFLECKKLIYNIAESLGISDNQIFFTYGNHDIDWRICKLSQKEESDPYYNHVAACAGSLFWAPESSSLCIEKGPVIGSGVFKIDNHRIYILNSGWSCTSEQEFPHGYLGQEQFDWLEQALTQHQTSDGWNIVISHHHAYGYTYPEPCQDISCIEEGADLLRLMGDTGIDMFCHGHRHHAIVETVIKQTWKKPITFFCAGSVAANSKDRANGKIPNLFHVISLEKRIGTNAATGHIKSFKHGLGGWNEIQNTTETPLDHEHWFGVPNAVQDMEQNITTFLEEQILQKPNMMIELPSRETLPIALKCCPLPLLNEKSKSIAHSLGYTLMGQWGSNNCIGLIKKNNEN